MKKQFLRVLIFFLLPFISYSSHYMGGEITWECLSNGQYKFTMKVYRECAGILFPANETINVMGHPTLTAIPMTRITQTDISPQCNLIGPHITCATVINPNQGAIEEQIFVSAPITLIGTPPATGWVFSWGSCCRNPSSNINNATSLHWRLRAIMYPYTPVGATTPMPADPCFDNSPTFAERPSTVICTGYPFTYNHNAYDQEMDVLTYEWAPPLMQINQPVVSYATGYSYTNPLPGPMHNANNIPATVDFNTGEISFTSHTQGAFQTVIKVTAYKGVGDAQIKVAEIFREMQIVLLTCGINNPPNITAPFYDVSTGLHTSYLDTFYVGDLIQFSLSATDFDFLPNGDPQTLTLAATGIQFGQGYTNPNSGCLIPPCATLTPLPPISAPLGVQTVFDWQTDCSHFVNSNENGSTFSVYNFIVKVKDDFCPIPGEAIKTITIVLKTHVLSAPLLNTVHYLPNNSIDISWTPAIDSMQIFNSYKIYYALNINGPYHLLDSITDINQSSYIDTVLVPTYGSSNYYFYMKTAFGCQDTLPKFISNQSNTIGLHIVNIKDESLLDESTLSHFVYPNPAQNDFTIIFNKIQSETVVFTLFNSRGSIVHFECLNNTKSYNYNASRLGNGLYFYTIHNKKTGDSVFGKIILNK